MTTIVQLQRPNRFNNKEQVGFGAYKTDFLDKNKVNTFFDLIKKTEYKDMFSHHAEIDDTGTPVNSYIVHKYEEAGLDIERDDDSVPDYYNEAIKNVTMAYSFVKCKIFPYLVDETPEKIKLPDKFSKENTRWGKGVMKKIETLGTTYNDKIENFDDGSKRVTRTYKDGRSMRTYLKKGQKITEETKWYKKSR